MTPLQMRAKWPYIEAPKYNEWPRLRGKIKGQDYILQTLMRVTIIQPIT